MKNKDIENDPEFSRDRIDPLSGEHFIANHRKRRHLNNKNKNEFHNWKRRVAKKNADLQWRIIIPEPPLTESRLREILNEKSREQSSHMSAAPATDPVISTSAMAKGSNGKSTINKECEMLAYLLGNKQECLGNIFAMEQAGFNFKGYDSRETIPDTSDWILNFGPYSINYYSETEIHITYRKYLLWEPYRLVINKNK